MHVGFLLDFFFSSTTRNVVANRDVDLVIYVWLEVGIYRPSVYLSEFGAVFPCIP